MAAMEQRSDRTRILSLVFTVILVLWGAFTLFVYLGSPPHAGVLLSEAGQSALNGSCDAGALFCRGVLGFADFLSHTIGQLAPLLTYLVLSLIAYAVWLGLRWFREERWPQSVTLRPWQLILLFLAMVWGVFLALSYNRLDGVPVRYVFEPTPQIYRGASEQTMEALRENFDHLRDAGCLRPAQYQGIPAFALTGGCLQGAFIRHVGSQFLFLLLLAWEFLILGRALLRLFRHQTEQRWLEALLSLGLGACGWMALLWALAVAGIYTAWAGWGLFLLVPAVLYPHTRHWLRQLHAAQWEARLGRGHLRVFLVWLLLSYLALNFLTVIRPFPIGWDDLGSYVNRPRLLVSYGRFIPLLPAFQWEYLTSLGFLLFGYDNPFGATAAMQVNWLAGLLAVLTVWGFGRAFLGAGGGILAALLYYLLPLVGHFSFADMKVDNAVFALGALALLCVFLPLFRPSDGGAGEAEEGAGAPSAIDGRWLLLAGVFCGFAFGVKATAAMVLMAAITLILGGYLGWWGYLAGWFLSLGIFTVRGILVLARVLERVTGSADLVSQNALGGGAVLVALVLIVLGIRAGGNWRRLGRSIGLFVLGFLVSIAPWVLHNNILSGNVIPRLVLGAPNRISPEFIVDPAAGRTPSDRVRVLPEGLALDPNSPMCKGTALQEELDRYWGNTPGWRHYLGLPWRSVMNLDAAGYYVTELPALLLFPLLLLLPSFWRRRERWLRALFIATLLLVVQWVFLANGVPWYGIGMFLGLALGLEALVRYAPNVWSRWLAGVLIGLSVLVALGMRAWQLEMQQNLYEYPMGKVSARVMEERTIPWYDDIRQVVVERHEGMPERPYLYRMGTFIPYFIPKNLEIIGNADNQLDFFNCLFQERDPELTLRRLNALGFNSMIFDTNTATIESNPNGTLHQKVNAFLDFANSPVIGPNNIRVNDPQAGVAFITLPETPGSGTGAVAAP